MGVTLFRPWHVAALVLGLSGCVHSPNRSGAAPTGARYMVGAPFQAGGEWRYPRVFNTYDKRGLAMIIPPGHAAATANGEAFRQRGLIAQSPVLPLPLLVRVTNLVNGRRLTVRVDDRGPKVPGRLLAVTRKVANLLGFPPDGVAEVRVRLLTGRSAALQAQLGEGPHLTAAPVAAVQQTELPSPGMPSKPKTASAAAPKAADFAVLPTRLSGRVTQEPPDPGALYVEIGGFGTRRDALSTLGRLPGLPATTIPQAGASRETYAVQLGPYPSVAAADAALQAVLARGVADPEITVQ